MFHKTKLTGLLVAFAVLTAPFCSQTTTETTGAPYQAPATDDLRIQKFETSIRTWDDRANKDARAWSIADRMAVNGVPGASVAIIEDGNIIWAKGYGVLSATSDEPVNAQSVFSAGSISKIINAALILRLVQDGQLDLDADVNTYLTSWKVPDTEFTENKKITLRMLLSHTSGLSQHGFPDFQPGEDLPTAL